MWRRTVVMCLMTAVLVGGLWVSQAIAQAPPRGDRPPRDPEQMRQRMEEFRTRMSEQMRERMGATEEEWKVLQPRIEKVQQLQRQGRGGFRGFGRGGRGQRPGEDRRPEGAPEREVSPVEKATEGLQKLLDDENAKPADIKAALQELRTVRAKAQAELATARKELLEVVTLRQEAQLVMMGVVE